MSVTNDPAGLAQRSSRLMTDFDSFSVPIAHVKCVFCLNRKQVSTYIDGWVSQVHEEVENV